MFKYCVWYVLKRNHPLSRLIIHLSEQFHTDLFIGHLTIASKLSYNEADKIYKSYCGIVKPWFSLIDEVYQTKTQFNNTTFYAIQQDYLMYNCINI